MSAQTTVQKMTQMRKAELAAEIGAVSSSKGAAEGAAKEAAKEYVECKGECVDDKSGSVDICNIENDDRYGFLWALCIVVLAYTLYTIIGEFL